MNLVDDLTHPPTVHRVRYWVRPGDRVYARCDLCGWSVERANASDAIHSGEDHITTEGVRLWEG